MLKTHVATGATPNHRSWPRRALLAVVALVVAAGGAATAAPASAAEAATRTPVSTTAAATVTPALASNFWTKIDLYFLDPNTGNDLFITHQSGQTSPWPWAAVAGQAWQFVQVVRPGFYNIYEIHAGDGSGCLAENSSGTVINVASCSAGYRVMWQLQFEDGIDGQVTALANVADGRCLEAVDAPGGNLKMATCLNYIDYYEQQFFYLTL